MKLTMISLACLMTLSMCREKESQAVKETDNGQTFVPLDPTYRPFLHKFTSTGCGGCARFGIPVFEKIAGQMRDSILPLMTHFKYNDPFINESSKAIETGVGTHRGSPQIWIENQEITSSIIRMPIEEAAEWCKAELRKEVGKNSPAFLGLAVSQNERGRFNIKLGVQNNTESERDWFIEVYGHEDSIWASQSGTWPPPHHDYVNRGGFYGETGKPLSLQSGEQWFDAIEYIPCTECTPKNMYFVLVLWELTNQGKLHYVNGKLFRP